MTLFERVHMPAFTGATEWLNSEPLGPRRAPRPCRPGEPLDLDVHQLAASGAARARMVADLPGRRPAGHRGPHAGVLVRARDRRRAARDEGAGDRLPGRRRQRLRDLERVHQPRLAGAVLRRRRGDHPQSALRRRSLREVRAPHPAAARPRARARAVEGLGVEAAADWDHLRTPETYLGYWRSARFSSTEGAALDQRSLYRIPEVLRLSHWALDGEWAIAAENVVLERAGGSIAYRFHARDAHVVLSRGSREPIRFRVLLDGKAPKRSHGVDVDAHGDGVLQDPRMYQLVRTHDDIRERTVQITFDAPGAEAYSFTFG